MSLKNFIHRDQLITCRVQSSVREAALLMKEHNINSIVVTEKERPKGIVTYRDIVNNCIARSLKPEKILVSEIMSQPVEVIDVSETIYSAARLMAASEQKRLVIVDKVGRATGMLSASDLLELFIDELNFLAEVMTPKKKKLLNFQVA